MLRAVLSCALACAQHFANMTTAAPWHPTHPSQLSAGVQLVEFAKHGYREVEPVPFYKSPTSVFGRVIAALVM